MVSKCPPGVNILLLYISGAKLNKHVTDRTIKTKYVNMVTLSMFKHDVMKTYGEKE
jgi:hypothetical protein